MSSNQTPEEKLVYLPALLGNIFDAEIPCIDDSQIGDGTGLPPLKPSHISADLAERFGATNIRPAPQTRTVGFEVRCSHGSGRDGVGHVADWPQIYWSLAGAIESHWPASQWLYTKADTVCLRQAVSQAREGDIVGAWITVSTHTGIPAAEMPGKILDQASPGWVD